MKTEIKDIYDLMYSEMITPYNLVDNAYLDNYEHITFYVRDKCMNVEMKVINDRNKVERYLYEFDSSERLMNITLFDNGIKIKLFDREKALKEKVLKFVKLRQLNKEEK